MWTFHRNAGGVDGLIGYGASFDNAGELHLGRSLPLMQDGTILKLMSDVMRVSLSIPRG
jgi:hypothetical protein